MQGLGSPARCSEPRGAAGAATAPFPGLGGEGRGQAATGTRFSVHLATLLTAEQFKCIILAHSISLEVQRTIHSETELQRHRIPLKEKFTNVAAPSLLPCLFPPPRPRQRQAVFPERLCRGHP